MTKIYTEYIRLDQAMKLEGLVSQGVEAKILIQAGEVSVNGEVEKRRGRKLYPGDTFRWKGKNYTIED